MSTRVRCMHSKVRLLLLLLLSLPLLPSGFFSPARHRSDSGGIGGVSSSTPKEISKGAATVATSNLSPKGRQLTGNTDWKGERFNFLLGESHNEEVHTYIADGKTFFDLNEQDAAMVLKRCMKRNHVEYRDDFGMHTVWAGQLIVDNDAKVSK